MSIMHCDKHDVNYDTDFVEDCFKCENELSEDDAMEREHEPVEYYVEPELPSEHNL